MWDPAPTLMKNFIVTFKMEFMKMSPLALDIRLLASFNGHNVPSDHTQQSPGVLGFLLNETPICVQKFALKVAATRFLFVFCLY